MTRVAALLSLTLAGVSYADAERGIERLDVYPQTISLETADDVQRLIVIATTTSGVTLDVTDHAMLEIEDASIARLEGGAVHPTADGASTLVATFEGQRALAPISVVDARSPRPIAYSVDVLPVLTVAGCNSGGCHGSARGQGGFRLSLYGFDPIGDWHRMTREMPGRRIDTAVPETSLLLQKSTGAAPHTGGKRFDESSRHYEVLRSWIEAGAPQDPDGVATVTGIEMSPPGGVLAGEGVPSRIVVRATYSDGTDRDVTDLSLLSTNNDVSLVIDADGRLRTGTRGEAFISASFDTFTVGVPYIILPDDATFVLHDPAGDEAANYVDTHVRAKLASLRMQPAPLCSDEVFLRRVYLDLVGMLPTTDERAAFLADTAADKRARVVDELLGRKAFADLWVMQWAELLQIRSNNQISPKAALLFFEWVRNAIADDVPVDQMVRRVLTSTGGTFTEPATNFFQNQTDTLVLMENVAQAFMGIRVQCAQCHNHPFDRWTQDDYYGFASFFAQVGRKRAEDPRETIVFDRGGGDVRHPVGNLVMTPKFLGGEVPDIPRGRDRRDVLAEWLTSTENPFFAKSLANRVWAHFMGVGIVEPVDDFRVSNPPSNGPLLDALATRLVDSGYDFKALVRDICLSKTYQRATRGDETSAGDQRNFAHGVVRRMRSETLLDVLCQVTDAPEKLPGLPLGARAVEIADGTTTTYFLTTFGRAPRDTVCACEVSREPSLGQALHLINGATVNRKIREGGLIAARLEAGVEPMVVVEELYVRAFGRMPSETERAGIIRELENVDDMQALLEDLFWAILNAREFVFNH